MTIGIRTFFCHACSRTVPRAAVRCPWCFRPVHAGIAAPLPADWQGYLAPAEPAVPRRSPVQGDKGGHEPHPEKVLPEGDRDKVPIADIDAEQG
ncbi:hypothetical protein [Chelatococcus composti]|uniref:Uncharacterized protein n=1 Tax=Chelatococcus composti TaxID=1743235 RepID=A0A841K9U0_9HYPH|nr:hypothetical protein [Chelatococcus composti]MBB6169277.1 hypothetical protein [Chelatococcus composti]MBS7735847.1 hypothetical protein [Chelatococcus composti]GGG46501.1 hypothetical protein GCM10008026_29630 [Chelatococcus composti]